MQTRCAEGDLVSLGSFEAKVFVVRLCRRRTVPKGLRRRELFQRGGKIANYDYCDHFSSLDAINYWVLS
jgi:hypothetical protein